MPGTSYSDFCQFYEVWCKHCQCTVGKYFVTKTAHLTRVEADIFIELERVTQVVPKAAQDLELESHISKLREHRDNSIDTFEHVLDSQVKARIEQLKRSINV
jgi:hypothetical protein